MMGNGRGRLVHRAAVVGQAIRTWRRRREANRQDAFVKAWKAAWTEGCQHRWRGGMRGDVPYVQEDQRAAWLAGWQWADTNPDRRRQGGPPARGYRRSTDSR